jgi:D-3-phosphoglycerate dehydrogenase
LKSLKVLITPRSFAKVDKTPMEMLKEQGVEIALNPYGRIMTKEEMMDAIREVDGIVVGVDPLDRDVLSEARNLKVISKYGVGTDNIDLRYAEEKGIKVTVTAGANTDAVADYTVALMLGAARRLVQIDRECRKSNWNKFTAVDIWGKTLGLIGMGNIGRAVAARAKGFNMKILSYDLQQAPEYALANGILYTGLQQILEESDFISLHLPLTDQTRHIIGKKELASMKSTAVIVNTARGGLIHEDALYEALRNKQIWGAGIDVFEDEPPRNQGFFDLDNIVISSHSAASTHSAVDNMGLMAATNLLCHLTQEHGEEIM